MTNFLQFLIFFTLIFIMTIEIKVVRHHQNCVEMEENCVEETFLQIICTINLKKFT